MKNRPFLDPRGYSQQSVSEIEKQIRSAVHYWFLSDPNRKTKADKELRKLIKNLLITTFSDEYKGIIHIKDNILQKLIGINRKKTYKYALSQGIRTICLDYLYQKEFIEDTKITPTQLVQWLRSTQNKSMTLLQARRLIRSFRYNKLWYGYKTKEMRRELRDQKDKLAKCKGYKKTRSDKGGKHQKRLSEVERHNRRVKKYFKEKLDKAPKI